MEKINKKPIVFRDDITIKIDEGGVAFTLGARDFKGVQCVSYQETVGCLSQGAHPGSYNGQDAYNDMLVTDDGILNSENRNIQEIRSKSYAECERLQGCNRPDHRGGTELEEPVMMSDRKGHNGITDDGTSTTLNAQEKERPIVGGGDAMASVVRRLTPLE